MQFSEWVKNQRTTRKWDMRELCDKSGVDNGSIARIEADKTQPTLLSAVRLWQAFDIPFKEFVTDLNISYPSEIFPEFDEEFPLALTISRVFRFLEVGIKDEQKACNFIGEWLNTFDQRQIHWKQSNPFGNFIADNFLDPSYTLPYPVDITLHDLSDFYWNGEAIIFEDGGVYMTLLRHKAKLTLLDLEKQLKISDTVLGRIERGSISNVKLKDLIQINNFLDNTGMFFGIYWMAGLQTIQIKEILAQHSTRRDALRIWPIEQAAYNLIKFQRWLRNDPHLKSEFLEDLRLL